MLGGERHLVFECASLAAQRTNCVKLFITTTMRPFFCAEQSLESFSVCHRLLDYDERIVIATRWHAIRLVGWLKHV